MQFLKRKVCLLQNVWTSLWNDCSRNDCSFVSLTFSPLLSCFADVKQYPNLIKSLSFLLNSYKPKSKETSSVRKELNGNYALSLVYVRHSYLLTNSIFHTICFRFMPSYSTSILDELEAQDRERGRVPILYWLPRNWTRSQSSWISCLLHQAKNWSFSTQLNFFFITIKSSSFKDLSVEIEKVTLKHHVLLELQNCLVLNLTIIDLHSLKNSAALQNYVGNIPTFGNSP